MNYIFFLNQNSKNHYKRSAGQKKTRRMVIAALALLMLIPGLVTLSMQTNNRNTLQTVDRSIPDPLPGISPGVNKAAKNTDIHITALALPEIIYPSEIPLSGQSLSGKQKTMISSDWNKASNPALMISAELISPKFSYTSTKALNTKAALAPTTDIDYLVTDLSPSSVSQQLASDKTITDLLTKVPAQSLIKSGIEKIITIKRGDTLSAIFKRLSLSSRTLYKIMKSGSDAKRLTRIKPGQKITFTLDSNHQLLSMSYPVDKIKTLVITNRKNNINTQIESKEVEIQQQFATASINASLFAAGSQAGLSNSMIMKLAQLFGWDIDFALDIRKGDSFSLVYEEKYINDKKISEGDILAAEFINQGKTFYAVRYTDASGRTDYYSDKGYSMRKAFLRTPVEFSRISSRFSSSRKHPVLNRIRAHKGVDYAASRGTPVKAAGKGKVIFKGKKGGYGRVIMLQHGSKYTTLYAHLNAYNKKIKKGSRVKQGQIIGYVGSSGLATGPHLHYEFRVNGVHRNPLTVPLPSAAPLASKYRQDYKIIAENMISQIKSRKQSAIALKSE